MNNQKALEVSRALLTIADFLKIEPGVLLARISLFDDDNRTKLHYAVEIHNSFLDMSFPNRARALGYEVEELKGKTCISTTL